MSAELPYFTVNRFSKSWNTTDTSTLIAEFTTIAKETNRKPDSYHFLVKKGILTDPNTNKPVLDFIAEGIEKNVARNLQSWAKENEEGMAIWISPDKEGTYPCPKIIIHQIAYTLEGEKTVLNTAILFDGQIKNSEHKRGTLYTFPDTNENILKILSFIKRKSGKEQTITNDRTTNVKAAYFANQIRLGISPDQVINEMLYSGFIGKNPISCPIRSTSQTFGEFILTKSFVTSISQEKWEYHTGSCRVCHASEVKVGPCEICKTCEKKFDKVTE